MVNAMKSKILFFAIDIAVLFIAIATCFILFFGGFTVHAEYQDGDFSPYSPQELFNRADELYYESQHVHLNPNSYFITKDNTWSGNRVNYTIYSFQDDVSSVSFNSNVPTTTSYVDSVNTYKYASVETSRESINNQPAISNLGYSSIRYYSSSASNIKLNSTRLQYLYSPNVTFVFNNQTIDPVVQYDASYYIGASGWNIQFGVVANENSLNHGWWVSTIPYKLQIQLTYNNQPIVFYLPNYKSYSMDIARSLAVAVLDSYLPNPFYNLDTTYYSIKYKPAPNGRLAEGVYITGLNTPIIDYDNTWIDPREDLQTVPLVDILAFLQETYPDMTFADLHQNMTFSWVGANDNRTYYSTVLRYGDVEFPEEAPPRDPDIPDWFKSMSELLEQMHLNQTYNYLTTYPQNFTRPHWDSIPVIESIPGVDYQFIPIELEGDEMNFWHNLVNKIYHNQYLEIVFIAALGFIVLKAVIH